MNFKIKIMDKEYYFKYSPNESDIYIILDLNLNDNNELIITNESKIIIPSLHKIKSIPYPKTNKNEYSKLNN